VLANATTALYSYSELAQKEFLIRNKTKRIIQE
jgi:hypothetical protein